MENRIKDLRSVTEVKLVKASIDHLPGMEKFNIHVTGVNKNNEDVDGLLMDNATISKVEDYKVTTDKGVSLYNNDYCNTLRVIVAIRGIFK